MLAVLIQAHPSRLEMALELRECLGGDVEVILDPDPESPHRSPWRTYRACLERGLDAGAESIFVMQEDVLVCGRLLEGVALAAAARPDRAIAFFVPGKPPMYTNAIYRARAAGAALVELPLGTWAPVVATLWPAALAERLLAWYDATNLSRQWSADDEIIGRFLAQVRTPILASVPSLVEHPDTAPSVMNGHRRVGDGLDPRRRAYFFIGDAPEYGCDATAINWSS